MYNPSKMPFGSNEADKMYPSLEAARKAALDKRSDLLGWGMEHTAPKREDLGGEKGHAVIWETLRAWTRLRHDVDDCFDLEISEPGPGKTKRTVHFGYPPQEKKK